MNLMKKSLVGAALLAAAVSSAWSAQLSLVPAAGSVAVGDSIDVDVLISGLSAGQNIGSFELTFNFDGGLLSLDGYRLGDALGSLTAFEALDISAGASGAGSFRLGEVSLLFDLSAQPSSFTLATLSLTGLGAGSSALGFGGVVLGDAWGSPIVADAIGGTLAVTAVPEPGTYGMMFMGLLALGAALRRRGA